jgi:hypothetical protein
VPGLLAALDRAVPGRVRLVPFVAETPKASQEGDVAALRRLRDCRLPA